jgi:predicted DNA-binding transcriptional regulator YafY
LSYEKAGQLLELARMAAGRYLGVALSDVMGHFRISRRSAQRMLRKLEQVFRETETFHDDGGRKRWRLSAGALRDLVTVLPDEVAALSLATEAMRRSGLEVEAESLLGLQEKVLALMPRSRLALIEPDLEALMLAQGLAARPGPRQRVERRIVLAIAAAIKACHLLEVEYRARGEAEPRPRLLQPYGLLTGLRRYLVARSAREVSGPMRLYLVESISAARVGAEAFERDPGFDLQAFAERAFGVFQNDEELGEVVWRFLPAAAEHAGGFEFHRSQQMERQADGSLIVRFTASGHLEMCWHLYAWGDQVEVLAPERLRNMVHAWRRSDFPSLP